MNPAFLLIYNKLEDQRSRILNTVRNLPEAALHASSSGKWSIAQILTHLLVSEKLSIGYMKKKSLSIESLNDSGIREALVLQILKVSQRIPFRYKAPKVIVDNTPDALSFHELTNQWEASRNELKTLLTSIPDTYTKRLIFKHPVAGRMNATQAMEFMQEHINHHLPQINKLLNQ